MRVLDRDVLKTLRWVAVVAPLAFLVGLALLLELALRPRLPDGVAFGLAGAVAALGVAAFSWGIFALLERFQARLERSAREWRALFELGQEVTAAPDVGSLLESVTERAQRLTGADVAVLFLLEPDGDTLQPTAHRGCPAGVLAPVSLRGDGLQALVLEGSGPALVADVRSDDRTAGRPLAVIESLGLTSALVVPFSAKGKLLGTLMAGHRQPGRFGPQEAELLQALADWAAVAVETHRLYEATKSLALLEERERIARDLHDGVIQSLYATGLALEALSERLEQEEPGRVRPQLESAIDALERVMQDIRDYIYGLRPRALRGEDLAEGLRELARGAGEVAGLQTQVELEEPLPRLDGERALAVYHVAQEAVSNVVRHAGATRLRLRLARRGQAAVLEVEDDGVGFDPEAHRDHGGQGLRNMADRARSVHGQLTVDSAPGRGTRVCLEVPLEEVKL